MTVVTKFVAGAGRERARHCAGEEGAGGETREECFLESLAKDGEGQDAFVVLPVLGHVAVTMLTTEVKNLFIARPPPHPADAATPNRHTPCTVQD